MKEELKLNIEYALKLRVEEGLTYNEIGKKIGRPGGTVKRWLAPYRNKKNSEEAKKTSLKGVEKVKEKYALLRVEAYESAKKTAEIDLQDKLLRDFINIYIGEGSKRRETEVSIVNSDPKIILLSLSVMKKYFLKENKKVVLVIRYYKENNNEKELLNYWKTLLKDNENITFQTNVQPTVKALDHNNSNKFGLVAVRIYDTYAKQKLNAYMDYLKEEWTKEFEIVFDTRVDRSITEIKATNIS